MLHKRDWVGVFGFAMMVFGVITFMGNGNGYLPLWVAWLIGPLFWYGGFVLTIGWIIARILAREKRSATEAAPKATVVELHPKRTYSNFLEHDSDVTAETSKSVLPEQGKKVAMVLLMLAISVIAAG